MTTLAIDAKEKRDIAKSDIPGACLNAEMEDVVHMALEGELAKLVVKMDPKVHGPYLH